MPPKNIKYQVALVIALMNTKAQGALEYLLIIGGAVLVGAIVIALITGTAETGDTRCLTHTTYPSCTADTQCRGLDQSGNDATAQTFFICKSSGTGGSAPAICPAGTLLFSTAQGSRADICAETSKRGYATWDDARSDCQAAYSGGDLCPQSFYEDMLNSAWCYANMDFGSGPDNGNEEWMQEPTEGRVDVIESCSSSPSYDTDSGDNEYRCCVG